MSRAAESGCLEGQVWQFVTEALGAARHRQSERPVVVLDLDSTLVHTGARHRAIASAFPDPEIADLAASLDPLAFGWDVRDPLRDRGVDEWRLDQLLAFWQDRFFHSDWLHHDLPARGAVPFTHRLLEEGAHLVYLTGRPEPTMGRGTRQSLPAMGFPTGQRTTLRMKPSTTLSDALYKRDATRAIQAMGPVAASFENEPAHANAFVTAFPDALHVLVSDVHHPKAPAPHPSVHQVADFQQFTG